MYWNKEKNSDLFKILNLGKVRGVDPVIPLPPPSKGLGWYQKPYGDITATLIPGPEEPPRRQARALGIFSFQQHQQGLRDMSLIVFQVTQAPGQ